MRLDVICVGVITLGTLHSAISQKSKCRTVSGPAGSGRDCIFPFTHKGQTYYGCPVDTVDRSKRWCSTRVDSNGVHVSGVGEFGHCGSGCPAQCAPKADPACRPIAHCSSRISPNDIASKSCKQANGALGLCCGDVLKNNAQTFSKSDDLGVRTDDFLGEGGFLDFNFRSAYLAGEEVVQEQERDFASQDVKPPKKGSASSLHAKFNKRRKGVAELTQKALQAVAGAEEFAKGTRNREEFGTRTTELAEDCNPRYMNLERECREKKEGGEDKFRTFDGTCNNENEPRWNAVNTPQGRILENDYSDGRSEPRKRSRDNRPLPNARFVSTTLRPRDFEDIPSTRATALLVAFGQFLDHDTTLVSNDEDLDCCTEDRKFKSRKFPCDPIEIPKNDPNPDFKAGDCMNFVRSDKILSLNCDAKSLFVINTITGWLDNSQVYGSDDSEARELRSFKDGLLDVDSPELGSIFRHPCSKARPGLQDLPPPRREFDCEGRTECPTTCFKAGDERINEMPSLTVIHTVFLREHNRIARELKRVNPEWADERLYLESRRILNAEYQHITYNEYLPTALGTRILGIYGNLPLSKGFSDSYQGDFDSRIMHEFSTAAFRIGHTELVSVVNRFSPTTKNFKSADRLKDLFSNVDAFREDSGVDELATGLLLTPSQRSDNNIVEDVTDNLFDGENSGKDLIAINIQRSRDNGIKGYVEYRAICSPELGGKARTFQDLSSTHDAEDIKNLEQVYDKVEDIDLFAGMFTERTEFSDALYGATFLCLINDQFTRLKLGDRYFYDLNNEINPGAFELEQLEEIRKVTMARLFCDNMDNFRETQPMAFRQVNNTFNPLMSCQDEGSIPKVDLRVFEDGGRGR